MSRIRKTLTLTVILVSILGILAVGAGTAKESAEVKEIEFREGWNLFGPTEPITLKELKSKVEPVKYKNHYVWHYGLNGWTHPDRMVPGEGYYIKIAEGGGGTIEMGLGSLKKIQFEGGGWNMVSTTEEITISELRKQGIKLIEYKGTYFWHYAGRSRGWEKSNKRIVPGKGYYVKVERGGTYRFDGRDSDKIPKEWYDNMGRYLIGLSQPWKKDPSEFAEDYEKKMFQLASDLALPGVGDIVPGPISEVSGIAKAAGVSFQILNESYKTTAVSNFRGILYDEMAGWDLQKKKYRQLGITPKESNLVRPLYEEVIDSIGDYVHGSVSLSKVKRKAENVRFILKTSNLPVKGQLPYAKQLNKNLINFEKSLTTLIEVIKKDPTLKVLRTVEGDMPTMAENLSEKYVEVSKSVDPPSGGSILLDPPRRSYERGRKVAMVADPAPGYKFDHWSGNFSGTARVRAVTLNSDTTLTAHFTETGGGEKTTGGEEPSEEDEGGGLPMTWIGLGAGVIITLIAGIGIMKKT